MSTQERPPPLVLVRTSHVARVILAAHMSQPKVGIIMGSVSDWETMSHAASMLEHLGVPFETRVVSAHRTPDLLFDYASKAESRGLEVIIAGAGGAAHLPGMTAAKTLLPVLGVPVESKALHGMDSLLSIVQMPAGVPVATFAIGKAGATNAALFAAQLLARRDGATRAALARHRDAQTQSVLDRSDPRVPPEAEESAPGSLSSVDSERRRQAAAVASDADARPKGDKT
jgi:5-(carboxyamino)imidazole ribonucleotide mutase